MSVLSWLELPDEDQPREAIWLNDEALDEHFAKVKERYASKAGGGMEDVPAAGAQMQDNEITRAFMK
jgi:hypothetical protein